VSFVPLREPAARAVMRGGLCNFISRMAAALGLTRAATRDLARSVLLETEQEVDQTEIDDESGTA
jgi:hypothetical protein